MQLDFTEIWRGIDRLAREKGLSISGLAVKAGLNPTTFNKSKRVGADGRMRWPSTESVNKVLEATGISALEFLTLASADDVGENGESRFGNCHKGVVRTLPLLGLAKAGLEGFFDADGLPLAAADGWDGVDFPDGLDERAYALEVSGNSMEPAYRDGDRLIVQPFADVRKGDRVVVKTREGEVLVKELKRKSALQIELKSLNPAYDDRVFDMTEILWVVRVLWVSQ